MDTTNHGTAIVRYDNLGGAEVVVTDNAKAGPDRRFMWHCRGCLEVGPRFGVLRPSREGADRHASRCRAKSQPR